MSTDDAIHMEYDQVPEGSNRGSTTEPQEVTSLRYIDYICGHVNMQPVLEQVGRILGIPIEIIEAPGDISGPRFVLTLI
jgi:hypothetical protein